MIRTIQITGEIRWIIRDGEKVLQQQWRCREDGSFEWYDVKVEEET